jgi:putative membrane protein
MMLLVSALVPGFRVSGFWTAFFASIVVTIISLLVGSLFFEYDSNLLNVPAHQGVMV